MAPELGSQLWYLALSHERIVELIWLLEGYEGMAVPRVLGKDPGVVELLVAPDLAGDLEVVIQKINKDHFPVQRIPKPEGVKSIIDEDWLDAP